MQLVRNSFWKRLIAITSTSVLTIVYFVILGTFYKTVEHKLLVNVLVWLITIFIAYYSYYSVYWIFKFFIKKLSKPIAFDGWSVFAGLFVVTIVCLIDSFSLNDYLYIEVMAGISGIVSTLQIIYSLFLTLKKRNENNQKNS